MIKGTKYKLDNATKILVASRVESEYMFEELIQAFSISFCWSCLFQNLVQRFH